MISLKLGDTQVELATSLRVAYSLRDISGAKNLQEAIASMSKLDTDGQIDLLYAAHAATKTSQLTKQVFKDLVLDNLGIFAIADAVNQVAEGLMYSGLSPEEVESKKAMTEKLVKTAGVTSSDKGID